MIIKEFFIGWVPVDEENKPVRPSRSGYSWQKNRTTPPRVYTTEGRAAGQSPVGKALEVYARWRT